MKKKAPNLSAKLIIIIFQQRLTRNRTCCIFFIWHKRGKTWSKQSLRRIGELFHNSFILILPDHKSCVPCNAPLATLVGLVGLSSLPKIVFQDSLLSCPLKDSGNRVAQNVECGRLHASPFQVTGEGYHHQKVRHPKIKTTNKILVVMNDSNMMPTNSFSSKQEKFNVLQLEFIIQPSVPIWHWATRPSADIVCPHKSSVTNFCQWKPLEVSCLSTQTKYFHVLCQMIYSFMRCAITTPRTIFAIPVLSTLQYFNSKVHNLLIYWPTVVVWFIYDNHRHIVQETHTAGYRGLTRFEYRSSGSWWNGAPCPSAERRRPPSALLEDLSAGDLSAVPPLVSGPRSVHVMRRSEEEQVMTVQRLIVEWRLSRGWSKLTLE